MSRGDECLWLFQRTTVWFLAATLGGSQQPVTLLRRQLCPLLAFTGTPMHVRTHTDYTDQKQTKHPPQQAPKPNKCSSRQAPFGGSAGAEF